VAFDSVKLSIYSDSLYTSAIAGSPIYMLINPNITGLNTIQHGVITFGSGTRRLNAKIDNDVICDDGNPLTVNPISFKNDIQLYPNPSSNFVIVQYNLSVQKNAYAIIYNLNGQKISNTPLNKTQSEQKIDVSQLDNGIYLCSIIADNKVIAIKKLVIAK
jgi:hypothetical protein